MASKLDVHVLATETISCFDQVVEMREISPTLANGEHQPGLESQGRAASMPRLAAETQVSEGGFTGGGRLRVGQELSIFSLLAVLLEASWEYLF